MGEVKVQCQLSNPLKPGGGELSVNALVDTGAVMVLVGRDIADKLGLRPLGKTVAILADESKLELERAGPLRVQIGERVTHVDCLVGEPLVEPLIGQLALEALDLVVDCPRRTVGPRPDSPAYPSYKLK